MKNIITDELNKELMKATESTKEPNSDIHKEKRQKYRTN